MAHTVKRIARGPSTKVNSYAGPAGELVMDTTTNDLVLETGVQGGVRMAKASTAIAAANGVSVTAGGTLGEATTISGVDATTSAKGVVQLSDATTGTSQTKAATEKAVSDALQAAKDYADTAVGAGYTGAAPIAVDASTRVISAADATTAAKGVVQVGDNVTVSSGTISVKPWADSEASHTSVTVADYQEGAIIVTDEPVGGSTNAVIAEVEQTVSSSTTKVPSSAAVQQYTAGVPAGTIIWNATVPAGYLLCNGAAVSRTAYPDLFNVIGTTFGPGDGSTTFNVPNLIDKFIEGSNTAGTIKAAGLPNITGSITKLFAIDGGTAQGVFSRDGGTSQTSVAGSATHKVYSYSLSAADNNAVYGNSDTVQPPAVTMLPCIKAFNSVTGDATVVAGQLVNDIQGKVALDGSNASSIGKTLSTYMAHSAMPSGQYVDLTLPASGGTVTAPADGWVYLQKAASANQYIVLTSVGFAQMVVASSAVTLYISVPASKGSIVRATYTASGATGAFRFFYANGSTPA